MEVFKGTLGMVLVVLAVVAMFGVGCGQQQPATPPTPTGNQPPVVLSLLADNAQVHPSGSTEIKCIAQDANGDQLNFTWACTGGKFSGIGAIVIWQAPTNYGTYTITVTVDDGKGGSVQSSLPITVVANQSPVISQLVANPSGLLYGGSTTLTCTATDPDGDVVHYSWSSSEGSITGVGNRVTWIAPNKGGNYNVTVLVSDDKGGETRGDVMVTVSAAQRSTTITPVAEETGTVSSKNRVDNSRTMAGDDNENIGYHAFWSFNIWSLAGQNIQNATLRFTTKSVVGDPFSSTPGLNGLKFWKVSYGDALPNFDFTGSNLISVTVQTKPPTTLDVTQEIANSAAAASTRFQVEALFQKMPSNGNNVAEFIEWSEVVLEVTYSE